MPSWVPDAVFYEIVPDRLEPPTPDEIARYAADAFEPWDAAPDAKAYKGGTLCGVRRHLGRLRELGVTALYLTPVHSSPTYHRYKPVDLTAVDPLLGGEEAFGELLAAAHALELRVVLDISVNHVGAGFAPFLDVVEYGQRSPYRDWFLVERWPVRPYTERPTFRCWNGNSSMPVLNHRNPAVRDCVVRAAVAWARRGVDGLRFDSAGEVEAPELFDELHTALKRVNPELYLLGETWTDAGLGLDGNKWDGATNYPFHFAVRELTGGRHLRPEHAHPGSIAAGGINTREYARRIDDLLSRHPWWHTLRQLNFVDGHDVSRFTTLVAGDRPSVELASLLLFTFPGPPCIYYGAEVGLEGGMPPDCRRGFPARSVWDEDVLNHFRNLIALRRGHTALRTGAYRTLHAEGTVYAALRADERERLVVMVNVGNEAQTLRLDVDRLGAAARGPVVIHGRATLARTQDEGLVVELAPRSGVVIDLAREIAARHAHLVDPSLACCEVVIVGNIGVDTNVYLPAGAGATRESTFTEDIDVIGQAGGYSSFGFAALGRRTGFVGYVGDDPFGRWIANELADARIEALLFTDPAGTARSVNLMAPDGTRKNFYDGKSHLHLVPDLARCREFLFGARHAHFHLANWTRRLLPIARELGLGISVDLQDVTCLDDPYRRDFVDAAQVLFCSSVNVEPEALGAALVARNPRAIVVIGMGACGAGLYTTAGLRCFAPPPSPWPVIDTNGAGDSLAVGFLVAHVLEGRPAEEAVVWGQTAARWACAERVKWRRLITRSELEIALRRDA